MMKNLYILFLMAFSCVSLAQSPAKPFPQNIEQLKDSIQKIMGKEKFPGIFLTMVTRDSVIFQGGIGVADRSNQRPATEQTLFRMGSVTKTFTAMGIYKLILAGKISPQDELKKLAPEIKFENPWESTHPVRLIHLLEHTAGFDDMHLAAVFKDVSKEGQLGRVNAYHKSLTSRWKPGICHSYSNPAYEILGFIIEKYSGKPYKQFMEEEVLRPMGMTASNYNYSLTDPAYSKGYYMDGEELMEAPLQNINALAAGELASNAIDMGKFLQVLLNSGAIDSVQFLPKQTIDQMETSASSLNAGQGTGYASAIYSRFVGEKPRKLMYGHNGGILGFSSDYFYHRQLGIGMAMSNNIMEGNSKIYHLVMEFMFRNFAPQYAPTPAIALDKKAVEPYLGYYTYRSSRNEMFAFADRLLGGIEIYVKGDSLYKVEFMGDPEVLIPTGPNTFKDAAWSHTAHYLMQGKDGELVYFSDKNYYEKSSWAQEALPRLLAMGALLACATCVVMSLIWLVMAFMKKISFMEWLKRSIPVGGILSLFLFVDAMGRLVETHNLPMAASINHLTGAIFVSTIIFAILAIIFAVQSVNRLKTQQHPALKYYCLVLAVSMIGFTIYMGYAGILGMRIWAW